MEQFLKERGIQESVIQKLEEDGIDASVITLMADEDIKRYLPRFGDQVAVIAFAKQLLGTSKHTASDRKLSLREKLITKLQNKKGSSEHLKRSMAQTGNGNGRKMNRKIELGWLHAYGFHGSLKQVRSPSGGGTRTIEVTLNCVIRDVLPVAQELFFPGGISKKGTINDFEFFIADQTHTKLDEALTFQELCDNTKMKHLRLYMVTYSAQSAGMISSDTDVETVMNETPGRSDKHAETVMNETPGRSDKHVETVLNETPGRSDKHVETVLNETPGRSDKHVETVLNETPGRSDKYVETVLNETPGGSDKHVRIVMNETPGKSDKHVETARNETDMADEHVEIASNGSTVSTNMSEPGEIMIQGSGTQFQFHDSAVSDYYDMEQSLSAVLQEENDYLEDFLRHSGELEVNTLPTDVVQSEIIRIQRAIILNELIPIFKDTTITNRRLQFVFVDEKGHDSRGLSRDVYAAFWDSFLLQYTDGEDFRIPMLSNELADSEWEALGRILLKGYTDLKYFPVSIAPAFFVAVCHGENAVTPGILKNSFLSFLSAIEKDVLEHALTGAEHDPDELIEILDRFECRCLPNRENLLSLILQIAHRVLIQEPKYAMDALQRVGQRVWRAEFPTVDLILAMYENLEPSVPKVLALFCANPMSKEQNEALKYLQKFVRGRSKEQLRHFLRFLTGSDMLCVPKIDITFVVRYGAGRVPTAHTCGPVLELPSTYVSYPDFRNEWESILQSKENMNMMIA